MKLILNQLVITVEIMVKKSATNPTFFDFSSDWRKYLIAGQIPRGGKNKLTK